MLPWGGTLEKYRRKDSGQAGGQPPDWKRWGPLFTPATSPPGRRRIGGCSAPPA